MQLVDIKTSQDFTALLLPKYSLCMISFVGPDVKELKKNIPRFINNGTFDKKAAKSFIYGQFVEMGLDTYTYNPLDEAVSTFSLIV